MFDSKLSKIIRFRLGLWIFFTQKTFQNVPIDIVEQYLGAAANTVEHLSRPSLHRGAKLGDPIGKVEWKMASFLPPPKATPPKK